MRAAPAPVASCPARVFRQRSKSRAKLPSKKCPLPQAGSIILNGRRAQPAVGFESVFVAEFRQAELLDGGVERAVEDELLDEDGRLEQRILLAGRRRGPGRGRPGTACPRPGREVVDEHARLGSILWKNVIKIAGRVAAQPVREGADRVVRAEDVLRRGAWSARRRPRADSRGRCALGGPEVELVLVARPLQPLAGPAILGVRPAGCLPETGRIHSSAATRRRPG